MKERDMNFRDDKYTVVKRDKLMAFATTTGQRSIVNASSYAAEIEVVTNRQLVEVVVGGLREAPGSYFVLRAGDVLAAPSLRAYVHTCLMTRELMDMSAPQDYHDAKVQELRQQRLLELADYAAGLADRWEEMTKKMPD